MRLICLAARVRRRKFGGAEPQVRRLCLLLSAPSSVAHPPSSAASSALACRCPSLCRLLAFNLPSLPLLVTLGGMGRAPWTPGGDHSPALRGLRPRGWDRRGPARAGGWPGARRRDVLQGGGWRRDAEGESVANPRTEPAKAAPYSCSACRAANRCAYAWPAVQTCAWPF